jgi:CheY-like chemotaxis protein
VPSLKPSLSELFGMAAKEKGLALDFVFDERIPAALLGDENRLLQILFNLLGNAIKFTQDGAVRVEAVALPHAGHAQVRLLFMVSDTGIGIADEKIKTIFEPFGQVEGAYTRRFQGAGLGLSIARKLAQLMAGELCIDSAAGEGTTVYLSLPFKLPGAAPGQAAHAEPAALGQGAPGLRILFAEDDAVNSLAGKRLLEKSGFDVTTAEDGLDVLQRLTEQDFDLILMDIQMLDLDGVEATKRIRASGAAYANIPIIAMTAYAMPGDKEKFLAAGMNGYLAKPVEFEKLTDVIRNVLARKTGA